MTDDLASAIATVRAAGFRVARYDDEHVATLGEKLWNSRVYHSRLRDQRDLYTAKAIKWASERVERDLATFKSYLDEGDPELMEAAMVAAGEVKE